MNEDTAAVSSPDLSSTPTPTLHSLLYNRNRDRRGGGGEGEMVQGWSEATLTGAAQSGRYSAWSNEEGEYDRVATEKVGRMFRCLNRALFEGRDSGFTQTDRECQEWSLTFPHLQVQGEHLLDTLDDGTEIAHPMYRGDSSSTVTYERSHDTGANHSELDTGLIVIGRHIEPITLSDAPEEEYLKEEILAQHGVLEEYIAFDGSSANQRGRGRKRPPPASHNLLPPAAGIHQVVTNQLFDILWNEVVPILLPLLIATRDRALKDQSSRQSLQTSLTASHSSSPRESSLLLSHPPLLPTTAGAATRRDTRYYQDKWSSLVAAPAGGGGGVLPPLVARPPPLSSLMHIRPVSLRHRNNMSLLHESDRVEDILSRLSIHNNSTSTSTTHHQHYQNGLNSYPRLPSLPYSPPGPPGVTSSSGSGYIRGGVHSGGRLLNTSRRPQQLRPIETPRTPALERIVAAQIRGYRLPVNATGGIVGLSPPPTAGGGVVSGSGHVMRNTQLPPLDIGTTGIPIPTERSPQVVRGKSTFFTRNSSAAFSDLQELRRPPLAGGVRPSDHLLRPSTSSSNFRADSGKPLGGKKLSDPATRGGGGGEGGGGGGGGMKIVGHATGVGHPSSSTGGATGMEGMPGGGGKMAAGGGLPYSIAEDEEEEWTEEDNGRLNITGYSSAILRSKYRSTADSRSKHRGHGR